MKVQLFKSLSTCDVASNPQFAGLKVPLLCDAQTGRVDALGDVDALGQFADVLQRPDNNNNGDFISSVIGNIRNCHKVHWYLWIPSKMEPMMPGPSSTDRGLPVLRMGSPTVRPLVSS